MCDDPHQRTLSKTIKNYNLLGTSVATICAAGLALPGLHDTARAQTIDLDELTIIGTRTEVTVQDNPRSVSVVDQKQLERQAPLSVGEAIRDVPGVELVDSSVPGMKRLRIRGESSRRVTILLDGQEITDHSTYGTPILINPAAIERIDVLRGPASVLYGAKAIGGVVDIITKKGTPGKAVEVELGGTYYSGTSGRQGWASAGGTVGNFDYRVTGGIAEHDNQKTPRGKFTQTGRLETTAFDADDISAHLGYTFGADRNHYLAVKAQQYRLDSESWKDPETITGRRPDIEGVTDFTIDLPQRDLKKIGIFYDGEDLGGPVAKVHFDAYYQTIDRQFENNVETFTPGSFIPFPPPFGTTIPASTTDVRSTSDDTLTNYGATGQIDLEAFRHHYTIIGVEYLADVLETDKTSTVNIAPPPPFGPPGQFPIEDSSFQKARVDTFSIFAQDDWELVPDLNLITGLRYNHIETKLDKSRSTQAALTPSSTSQLETSTSVALTYTGFENTTLRALYSSGYINPTLLQSFGQTSAGGETVFGNPGLELETANNYELGLRFDGTNLAVDVVGYYTKSKDYITDISCSTTGVTCPQIANSTVPNRVYVNVDEATTWGVELLTQYTIPGTRVTPYATGAYTRRRLDFAEFSTYDTNVPRLSARFGLRIERQFAGINAWADLFARASTDVKETLPGDDGPETKEVDGWGTLNLAFGGTYGQNDKYRLVVELNNITDEEYRPLTDALPGVGRSVAVTAAVKF
ncbi:MAG: TonB-dependent receptor [Hyphomicrobiaceae bacterium]|nr:TonB-dependent receptor [Hyphomicrobiaceae bacterium]